MIYKSIEELVGHTPLYEPCRFCEGKGLAARLLLKLEYFNPTGSAKDRAALSIILAAEKDGTLKPGATIIEPTSGNTGVALAAFAAAHGYRTVLTMPDSMSAERRALLAAHGAELVLTPGAQGMAGAIAKANELHEQIAGSIIGGQFENPANPEAHYRTTGPEIFEDAEGRVDFFVAGVGTGGTFSGTVRYLKERNPALRGIAVEPANSAVMSGEKAGAHGLMGIGAGFIPKAMDMTLVDEIKKITDEQAYAAARELAQKEGIITGITSGAAIAAALEVASRGENAGKTVVALLPDTGERYLSTPLYAVK